MSSIPECSRFDEILLSRKELALLRELVVKGSARVTDSNRDMLQRLAAYDLSVSALVLRTQPSDLYFPTERGKNFLLLLRKKRRDFVVRIFCDFLLVSVGWFLSRFF